MILINIYGGPGAGKSTAAAALFVGLKNQGMRVALVGEAATELILDGQERTLMENQPLVTAMQAERILRLSRAGYKVAIADSPILLGYHYAKQFDPSIADTIKSLAMSVERGVFDVYVRRAAPADTVGRIQKNIDAMCAEDKGIYSLGYPYHIEINGNVEGQRYLIKKMSELLKTYDTTY